MSNPAVISLAQVRTKCGEFSVEDNLGESIHLHLGDFRWDITIDELDNLSKELAVALEGFINVEGFSVAKFSSEFLLQLAENNLLPYLESVEEDDVTISDMKVSFHNIMGGLKYKSLLESKVLKALNGYTTENDKSTERNYFNQTSQERVEEILESVRLNGYPCGEQKIVLYKDDNRIYDGQHRAACVYSLVGNKNLPVIRIGFCSRKIDKRNRYYKANIKRWLDRIVRITKKVIHLKQVAIMYGKMYWVAVGVRWDRLRFRNVK